MKRLFVLLLIAAAILSADFLLKSYVSHHLPEMSMSPMVYPYGGIGVFRDWQGIQFSITHATNHGAAWSLFSSHPDILLYVRIAIIGGLLSYLCFVKKPFGMQLAFIAICSGAIGNVIDSFIYGHVIDMFYFIFWGYSYPVFNIADSAIFCGVAFLFIESLFRKKTARASL